MLGSLILYLKGMRRMMFQLSGFYYRGHSKHRPKRRGSGRSRSQNENWSPTVKTRIPNEDARVSPTSWLAKE